MRRILTTLIAILLFCSAYSQDTDQEYKPAGVVFFKIFTNYHSTFTDGDNHNAFELNRAYLGYAYQLSEKISGKIYLDAGNPGIGSFSKTAYLKNAYLQYKNERLTTKFGIIGLNQFKLQENQWSGRYMYKSFQDKHKFGNSSDLAIYAAYKLSEMISIDATIANGEGHKSVEVDSLLKYSAGFTATAAGGLEIRAYYDIMGNDNAQQTLSFYAGYSIAKLRVGAEYNRQLNHKITASQDMSGISLYASYMIKKARAFCRFDQLSSATIENDTDPWNYAKDGRGIFAGIEFAPALGFKIAPNYQLWLPANGNPAVNIAYLSCEIKF